MQRLSPALNQHAVSQRVIPSAASPSSHLQQLVMRQQLDAVIAAARQVGNDGRSGWHVNSGSKGACAAVTGDWLIHMTTLQNLRMVAAGTVLSPAV